MLDQQAPGLRHGQHVQFHVWRLHQQRQKRNKTSSMGRVLEHEPSEHRHWKDIKSMQEYILYFVCSYIRVCQRRALPTHGTLHIVSRMRVHAEGIAETIRCFLTPLDLGLLEAIVNLDPSFVPERELLFRASARAKRKHEEEKNAGPAQGSSGGRDLSASGARRKRRCWGHEGVLVWTD